MTETSRARDILSPLSQDDVRQIAQLVDMLDRSSLDFLEIELGDLKLTIRKGDAPPLAAATAAPAAIAAPTVATTLPLQPAPTEVTPPGRLAIAAPIMGRFYARPDPGSPPFVSVGSEVVEDTTVALIEVMKVFNAVPAGMCGVITEICVQDTEIVEYGQVMFLVRPAEA